MLSHCFVRVASVKQSYSWGARGSAALLSPLQLQSNTVAPSVHVQLWLRWLAAEANLLRSAAFVKQGMIDRRTEHARSYKA